MAPDAVDAIIRILIPLLATGGARVHKLFCGVE
jgi:hypothetical protein